VAAQFAKEPNSEKKKLALKEAAESKQN